MGGCRPRAPARRYEGVRRPPVDRAGQAAGGRWLGAAALALPDEPEATELSAKEEPAPEPGAVRRRLELVPYGPEDVLERPSPDPEGGQRKRAEFGPAVAASDPLPQAGRRKQPADPLDSPAPGSYWFHLSAVEPPCRELLARTLTGGGCFGSISPWLRRAEKLLPNRCIRRTNLFMPGRYPEWASGNARSLGPLRRWQLSGKPSRGRPMIKGVDVSSFFGERSGGAP